LRRRRALGFAFALVLLFEIAQLLRLRQGQAEGPIQGYHIGAALLMVPAMAFVCRTLFTSDFSRRRFAIAVALQLSVLLHVAFYFLISHQHYVGTPPTKLTTTEEKGGFLAFVDWLNEHTTPEARILVESSHNSDAQVLGFDFVGLLPTFVPNREFIALPTVESPGALYSTYLMEGILSWLPIETYSDEELAEYMRIYNIGWVVASHPKTIERLDGSPGLFEQIARLGPIRVYAAKRAHSFFLKGSGRVRADLNRIELADLAPDENGDVVIAYRYFGSLKSLEGVPLDVYEHPLDPFGFIKIHNPPESLTIVNDTSNGFPGFGPSFKRYIESILNRYRELGIRLDVPPGTGIQRR